MSDTEFQHGDIVAVDCDGGKTAMVVKGADGDLWVVFRPGEGEPMPLRKWQDEAAHPLELVMRMPEPPRLHHNDGKPVVLGRRQFKKERALAKAVSKKLRRQK